MTTEKVKTRKPKSGSAWWVLRKQHDDLYSLEYRGTDRAKARDRAQQILSDDEKAQLLVGKMGRATVLGSEHLQAQLPKDAF